MLEAFEAWCQLHQYIIAAISSLSTFAAVVTSLSIAFFSARTTATHLSANMTVMTMMGGQYAVGEGPDFCTVVATNKGLITLSIPYASLYLKAPFKRNFALLRPVDCTSAPNNSDVANKTYPFEIGPRKSETFYFLSPAALGKELDGLFNSMIGIQRLFFTFSRFRLCTADGKIVTVKQSEQIKQIFRRVKNNAS